MEALLLYSTGHDEAFLPNKVFDGLKQRGIQYDFSGELTLEKLDGYTGLVLNNPKDISEEEVKNIIRYKNEKESGIFMIIDLLNESQADRFYQGPLHFLAKSLFDAEVVTKRVLPKYTIGEYELTYETKGLLKKKKIKRIKRTIEVNGEKLGRRISYVLLPHLPWIPKCKTKIDRKEFDLSDIQYPSEKISTADIFENVMEATSISENDVDFITAFCADKSDEGEGRTILLRNSHYPDIVPYPFPYSCAGDVPYSMKIEGETYWITYDSRRFLMDLKFRESLLYRTVGITSQLSKPGRAIGICAFRKLLEAIDIEKFQVLDFIAGCLKWISAPRKNRVMRIIDQEAGKIREFEDDMTRQLE